MTKQSNFLSLNERDAVKGFIVAMISAFLTSIYNLIVSGTAIGKEQLINASLVGIAGGLGYLIKNFLTPGDPVPQTDTQP